MFYINAITTDSVYLPDDAYLGRQLLQTAVDYSESNMLASRVACCVIIALTDIVAVFTSASYSAKSAGYALKGLPCKALEILSYDSMNILGDSSSSC
ncbi:MAG: hypothetical protein KAR79_05915 [Simkaniaceae bacterium]|nr:hypothetical protein [Simkaniaceae bacterium]